MRLAASQWHAIRVFAQGKQRNEQCDLRFFKDSMCLIPLKNNQLECSTFQSMYHFESRPSQEMVMRRRTLQSSFSGEEILGWHLHIHFSQSKTIVRCANESGSYIFCVEEQRDSPIFSWNIHRSATSTVVDSQIRSPLQVIAILKCPGSRAP
jgi:hypothetical protein